MEAIGMTAEGREDVVPMSEQITGDTSDGYHTFNELYAYRKAYNAALFNEWAARGKYDVHKSWWHSDGERCFGGGWFIVVAQTPAGQISNHYESADWPLFQVPERERGNEWDGHTPQIALARLMEVAAAPPEASGTRQDKEQEATRVDKRTDAASAVTPVLARDEILDYLDACAALPDSLNRSLAERIRILQAELDRQRREGVGVFDPRWETR